MTLSKTQRIAGLSLAAVALILFFVFRPAPLPVDTGVVRRGPLQVTLDGEGVTRVNDRYVLAAPVTGKLLRMTIEEGDSVRKGSVLASLLPPELDSRAGQEAAAKAEAARALFAEANARHRRALLTREQADRHAVRYRNLKQEGAVSLEAAELAASEAAIARKEAEAAGAAATAARYSLDAIQTFTNSQISGKPLAVISPADGRVLRIHEKSERLITAGSPIVDIGDPSAIEIVIDVLSSEATKVRPGNPVVITAWGGRKDLRGVVKSIEPAAYTKVSALGIEEKRVNIVALLNAYEPLLGDNFRVQAEIVLSEANNVLQVPVSALFRGKDEWHLFVIDGGKAVEKAVRIGMRGTWQAELLSGLREGEKVVVHPTNELRDGMRVKIQE
ncbi:efflux RND transporter periplasmic adaptor subunit [Chlorobium ferrooxidans]|uniref:Secretion protein HlyD n=1 Tax=Chlorobium ferrooxidans DSM 13031 TaxID=377431 RepID=Q0YQF3_9CHLB|nr:efflux RND transporter periplasmic adaptor subunit [Chlorobium ferrooxidans]EAT58557.1 Secretion protein HlyD [Chlorobium ferrooxidans DSM 13031]